MRRYDYIEPRWQPQVRWQQERVQAMPGFVAREMSLRHSALVGTIGEHSTSPHFVANQWLVATEADLRKSRIWDAFDEQAIREHAEKFASACGVMGLLGEREDYAQRRGVQPPPAKFLAERYEARAKRLADPKWWRRKLRAIWTRAAEEGIRRVGLVRKGKAPYASDTAVHHRAGQKRRMREYCEAHVAVNELGEQLGLFELHQGSVSNPTLRRGEFMTRVRGFEELAQFRKDEALFFTLTVPSHFHPQRASGGANPSYDNKLTVRHAQQWLCKHWARFRAAIARKKITIYGFRIAEPHHDGTPHWHGLLFCKPADVAFVEQRLRAEWLKEFGDDPGARDHRVRVEHIDASKGSAAGYIAKYVSKNIDGAGAIGTTESDETGEAVNASLVRVDAWASVHGIRQFQQIGGPTVGLWRECRRVGEEELDTTDADIARCARAADRGSYFGFCRSVTFDGQGTRRSSLKLWKEETGETNQYGECRGARTVGLRFASARLITRPHQWRIERKGRSCSTSGRTVSAPSQLCPERSGSCSSAESFPPLGPVAITVRVIPGTRTLINGRWWEMAFAGQPGVDPASPWVPAREISDHLLQ
jgi:hypothetical protein